jgi:hypothetical protein
MNAPVPAAYLGLWKRTLLRSPTVIDTVSTVHWLQTPVWHSDLRVPVGRSGCDGLTGLDAASPAQLRLLAAQQGFAGITVVDGDHCQWDRRVDFQPPSGFRDIGRIVFETSERMLEYGVEQNYFEIWERVPGSVGETGAWYREEDRACLTRAGLYAMRVRPRLERLAPAHSLATVLDTVPVDQGRALVDFEISLAKRDAHGAWHVLHSTLPWIEGTPLADGDVLEAAGAGAGTLQARHWVPMQ